MKTRTIRQSVTFRASPHEVYELLMDSRKHSHFTKSKAKISREVGGKFTAYDGWIEGINLELVKDKKIVQKWRGVDWPKGHYSKVTFLFEKMKDGTKLKFTQTDVPEEHYQSIKEGWYEHYWEHMKKMLNETNQ